ncbi:MAG TPA: hypothetical protein VFF86_01340 [Candidatus Methylomirabilis sp.]|nr:hypothetical protein [Candidatus Methylomirabilis sp.]
MAASPFPYEDLGRSWAAPALRNRAEPVGGTVVESFHRVPVAVHCHLDRLMTELGLDGFGVLSGGDQPGGVSVPEMVDSARWSHRGG